jgi:AcrR family transcriptional regulator
MQSTSAASLTDRPDALLEPAPPMSLREEKKEITRRALIDEAVRRFRANGYDATTLDEIAAAVKVSMRTLLRYFESKERLFHAWHYETLDRFRRELANRPEGETVMACWRNFVDGNAIRSNTSADFVRLHVTYEDNPSLHAHWLMILRLYEDLLAEAFEAEAGVDRTVEARLAAVTLVGGNDAAARRWIADGATTDLRAGCMEVIDIADRLYSPFGIGLKRRTRRATKAGSTTR